jgi:hypothetical protein
MKAFGVKGAAYRELEGEGVNPCFSHEASKAGRKACFA